MPVAQHHLCVRAHIHQHHDFFFLIYSDRKHVGGDIRAHMRADEGPAVHIRIGEDAQSDVRRLYIERRRLAPAIKHFEFCERFVGTLTYRLHIEAEEYVAHGGIADYDYFIDAPAMKLQSSAEVAYLEVDGRKHYLLQFARIVTAVIRDAVHYVAAAESLRVLEGRSAQYISGLEIEQIQHDGRGANINRDPVHLPAIVVNARVAEEHAVTDAPSQGIYINVAAH